MKRYLNQRYHWTDKDIGSDWSCAAPFEMYILLSTEPNPFDSDWVALDARSLYSPLLQELIK